MRIFFIDKQQFTHWTTRNLHKRAPDLCYGAKTLSTRRFHVACGGV